MSQEPVTQPLNRQSARTRTPGKPGWRTAIWHLNGLRNRLPAHRVSVPRYEQKQSGKIVPGKHGHCGYRRVGEVVPIGARVGLTAGRTKRPDIKKS